MDVREMLSESGALLEGHFILSSGNHSANYLQCAIMLQHPHFAEHAGRKLGERLKPLEPDLVISPALGGVVIGQETGRALGIRAVFAERKDGVMMLRRGFKIQPEERVVVVEDVVTTGGSVKEVIHVVREAGGIPVSVGSIVFRAETNPFDIPFEYLWNVVFPVYTPEECPLCRSGSEAVKPGSRN